MQIFRKTTKSRIPKFTFGSRNKLLAISEDNIDYLEIDSDRSDNVLVNHAEHMFQNIFTDVNLPMKNNPHNICTNSVNNKCAFLFVFYLFLSGKRLY